MKNKFKLVLASGSPRRKELLEQVNLTFEVIKSEGEEIIPDDEEFNPENIVMSLAKQKAVEVFERINETNTLVLGADTVVVHNNEILGKPKSVDDAYNMISSLSGDTHEVYTGVSIAIKIDKGIELRTIREKTLDIDGELEVKNKDDKTIIIISTYVMTKVKVRKMSDEQIKEYISTDEPYDKAGGYGIQGSFAVNIKEIQGDYYNVVGLPINTVYEIIERFNEML